MKLQMWDVGTIDVVLLLDLKMAEQTSVGGFFNGYETIPFADFRRNGGRRCSAPSIDTQNGNQEKKIRKRRMRSHALENRVLTSGLCWEFI